jgi:hypothetical protein
MTLIGCGQCGFEPCRMSFLPAWGTASNSTVSIIAVKQFLTLFSIQLFAENLRMKKRNGF